MLSFVLFTKAPY